MSLYSTLDEDFGDAERITWADVFAQKPGLLSYQWLPEHDFAADLVANVYSAWGDTFPIGAGGDIVQFLAPGGTAGDNVFAAEVQTFPAFLTLTGSIEPTWDESPNPGDTITDGDIASGPGGWFNLGKLSDFLNKGIYEWAANTFYEADSSASAIKNNGRIYITYPGNDVTTDNESEPPNFSTTGSWINDGGGYWLDAGLFNIPNDTPEPHNDGSLSGYYTSLIGPTANTPQKHFNIRSFNTNDLTMPRSNADCQFPNIGYFQGMTLGRITTQTISGSENWTGSGSLTVSGTKAAQWRYSPMLICSVTGTNASGTATSTGISDNLFQDFNFEGTAYDTGFYIEMILRSFPGQLVTPHFDLNNSFVQFSSDSTFNDSVTDSVPLSASLRSLNFNSTQDAYFLIDRSSLSTVDLGNVNSIRFKLKTVGAGTAKFQVQSLKMYPLDWTPPNPDIDTRRGRYGGSLGISGTISNPDSGLLLFQNGAPKNIVQVAKFNSGHAPVTASGTNHLDLFHNYVYTSSVSNHQFSLDTTTTATTITLKQTISGSTTTLKTTTSGSLPNETEFIFKAQTSDNKIRGTVYRANSSFEGITYADTGWVAITDVPRRGRVGFQFKPYNYDFTLDYIRLRDVQFGQFQTKPFPSRSPLTGVKLIAMDSADYDLTTNTTFKGVQNTTFTENAYGGIAPPDTKFTRLGTQWYGGYQSTSLIDLGSLDLATIEGDILPYSGYTGTFRAVLLDQYGLVGFIAPIGNLTTGGWSHFKMTLNTKALPSRYYLLIENIGYNTDTFELDNIQINHRTISWYATSDGNVWQPFFDEINGDYKALHFGTAGSNLALRAYGFSDQGYSWIQSYTATPLYKP